MKKLFNLLLISGLFCTSSVFADENIIQKISNEKTYASIDLNSQIKPDGNIQKQEISNKNSWFNININRNTYKFYVPDFAISEPETK